MGRAWLIGALVFVGALVAARAGMAWYWPLAALAVAAGTAWILTNWRSKNRSGTSDRAAGSSTDPEAALETLKEQYAVGEIDDAEFERRLETLLENETIADVENRVDVDSETESETPQIDQEATKQTPRHRQKCGRRGRHHGHGRH